MSKMRTLMVSCIALACAGTVLAEKQGTVFTVDNTFPRWQQLELGLTYFYEELTDDAGFDVDTSTVTAGLRYGLRENLYAKIDLPFVSVDPVTGNKESGLGDVRVGLALRAWQDIFDEPFLIPHLTVGIPTGDEDKGLGTGETSYTPGISFGYMIRDLWTWVLDLSYEINPDAENELRLATSLSYTLAPDVDLAVEVLYQDRNDDDSTVTVIGGLVYDWSTSLQFSFHLGSVIQGEGDVGTRAQVQYSF